MIARSLAVNGEWLASAPLGDLHRASPPLSTRDSRPGPVHAPSGLGRSGALAVAAASLLLGLVAAAPAARGQEVTRRRGFSIKIVQPANQELVFGKTKITADVKIDKPEAVEKVEFYVGDKLIFIDEEAPYECFYDFGPQSREYVIKAVAYHREGITVSDFVVTRRIDLSFAVKVNRVLINASVFNKDGDFVSGLGKDDFVVYEEGAPRQILEFSLETRPILMGIVMDTSGSMLEAMEETHQAACAFVDTLREADRAMLVEFNEKVFLLSDLSGDREALKHIINSTEAIGGTALYDALHVTLRRLKKYEGRKAIVLLTDGEDTESAVPFKQVLEEAKASDVLIYTIALGQGFLDATSIEKLQDISKTTGARSFRANKASRLAGIYSKIAEELRSQYALTYASENEKLDGRWIPIKIEAKPKDLEVRSRQGYFAAAPGE